MVKTGPKTALQMAQNFIRAADSSGLPPEEHVGPPPAAGSRRSTCVSFDPEAMELSQNGSFVHPAMEKPNTMDD